MTIEPGGKDLSTAGGSRDRSDAIAREVFEREPPLNVPYEFLNIGGQKMSTSKGRGAAAHTIAEVIPPEQLRFLFLRPRPNQAIEFDPDGHRRGPAPVRRVRPVRRGDRRARGQGRAAARLRGDLPLRAARPDADVAAEAAAFRPAFAHLALLVQIPGVDVAARVEAEKGSALTARERAILDERVAAARAWLEAYAPERARSDGPPRRVARRGDGARGETSARSSPRSRTSIDGQRHEPAATRGRTPSSRCDGDGAAGGTRLRGASTSRSSGATERAARRLAAGKPRPGVRRRTGLRGRSGDLGRRCRMSVGLQRLREEPDVIRDGAIHKGEDPALVDRALELDADRRRLLAEGEALKAERNAASKRVGEAIKGGAAPDGPEVADLRAASTAAGDADRRARRGARDDRGGPRRPAPAHPEPARPRHPGRWRGGERHDPHLGRHP